MHLGTGPVEMAVYAIGGVFGLLLAALLLRSACDLCSVDPSPSYLRCLLLTAILTALAVPVALGAAFAGTAVISVLRASHDYDPLVAVLLALPVSAVVATAAYVVAFRVRVLKGATVWLINSLINAVVVAVLLMVLVGGWTMVDCARRLF